MLPIHTPSSKSKDRTPFEGIETSAAKALCTIYLGHREHGAGVSPDALDQAMLALLTRASLE